MFLIWISLIISDEHIFKYLWPSVCLFGKNDYEILCLFCNYFVCFFCCWVLYIFCMLAPYQIMICKYLLSFSRLLFHCDDSRLCYEKLFLFFDIIPFVCFCFCSPCFLVRSTKNKQTLRPIAKNLLTI